MADGFDGEIRLGVKLTPTDVKKTASQLQQEIEKIFNTSAGQKTSKQFQRLETQMDNLYNRSSKLQDSLKQMEGVKTPTEEYKKLEQIIQKNEQKLNAVNKEFQAATTAFNSDPVVQEFTKAENAYQKMQETLRKYDYGRWGKVDIRKLGVVDINNVAESLFQSEHPNEYQEAVEVLKTYTELKKAFDAKMESSALFNLGAEAEELENSLQHDKAELQDLVETGKAFTLGSDTQKYKDTANQLNSVNNQMVQAVSATEALQQEEEELPEPVQRTSQAAEHLKSAMSKVGNLISKVLHGLGNMTKALGGKIISAAKKLVSHFSKLGHHSDKHQLSLKKMARMMLKYGLGIRSVFLLWRKLRSYATEAIKTMARNFEEVDADVSMLMNSFNQMKNSMGTMVQPLLHALAPALNYIIGLITSAMNALANFFAILTGQKYIYKATKQNKSYADSLGGVGGAAKDANKELAEYDNLLVIKSQEEGSGGGGGGGADTGAGLFEKVEAESDFAKQLKDAINKGDWEGVGGLFADKLNIITKTFDNWVNKKFRPAGKKWAKRIGSIIGGFFDNWDSELTGKTLGDTLMAGFDIGATFFESTPWKLMGTKVAGAVNGLFGSWEPETVARFLVVNAKVSGGHVQNVHGDIYDTHPSTLVVVDEASMLNFVTAYDLLKMVAGCTVVFVGDKDQLPPIEPGAFLTECLASQRRELTMLTKNFRTDSLTLNENSDKVVRGESIKSMTFDDSFMIMGYDENSANEGELSPAEQFILTDYKQHLATGDFSDILLVSPFATSKYRLSAGNLNKMLQNALNPLNEHNVYHYGHDDYGQFYDLKGKYSGILDSDGLQIRVGDRVMNTKNNMELSWQSFRNDNVWSEKDLIEFDDQRNIGIFNGDVGTVIRVYEPVERRAFSVLIELDDGRNETERQRDTQPKRYVCVEADVDNNGAYHMKDWCLGYALSVHKAQGSEASHVIVALSEAGYRATVAGTKYHDSMPFLTRNMLYTALTRAKDSVVVVGSVEAFNACLKTPYEYTNVRLAQAIDEFVV